MKRGGPSRREFPEKFRALKARRFQRCSHELARQTIETSYSIRTSAFVKASCPIGSWRIALLANGPSESVWHGAYLEDRRPGCGVSNPRVRTESENCGPSPESGGLSRRGFRLFGPQRRGQNHHHECAPGVCPGHARRGLCF